MPCPHENAVPVDALLDVLIDEENDSIWPYSLAKAHWSSDSTQDKNPIVQKKNIKMMMMQRNMMLSEKII